VLERSSLLPLEKPAFPPFPDSKRKEIMQRLSFFPHRGDEEIAIFKEFLLFPLPRPVLLPFASLVYITPPFPPSLILFRVDVPPLPPQTFPLSIALISDKYPFSCLRQEGVSHCRFLPLRFLEGVDARTYLMITSSLFVLFHFFFQSSFASKILFPRERQPPPFSPKKKSSTFPFPLPASLKEDRPPPFLFPTAPSSSSPPTMKFFPSPPSASNKKDASFSSPFFLPPKSRKGIIGDVAFPFFPPRWVRRPFSDSFFFLLFQGRSKTGHRLFFPREEQGSCPPPFPIDSSSNEPPQGKSPPSTPFLRGRFPSGGKYPS